MAKINCFIPVQEKSQVIATVEGLKSSELVSKIYLLATEDFSDAIEGCEVVKIDSLQSSATVKKIAELSDAEYSLIYTKYTTLELGYFAMERFVNLAQDSAASMLYADHYQITDGVKKASPVIDYQFGSLRDDFNFGSVLFYNAEAEMDLDCGMGSIKIKF